MINISGTWLIDSGAGQGGSTHTSCRIPTRPAPLPYPGQLGPPAPPGSRNDQQPGAQIPTSPKGPSLESRGCSNNLAVSGDARCNGRDARADSNLPVEADGSGGQLRVQPSEPGRHSCATSCQSLAQRAVSREPVPPTNRQRTIKRPDRRCGNRASDLHFLVAGAGFEPATSGL